MLQHCLPLAFILMLIGYANAQVPDRCSSTLLFASDTQQPMWVEKLWLKSHENERATAALFKELLSQEPTDLFLLGDVVNLGYKQSRWTLVDSALAGARKLGFEVNALLGNHEVMERAAAGERAFQSRFPAHVKTGYCVRKDSIAVVLLNSNFSKLTAEERDVQLQWYGSTLAVLDTTKSVAVIIVCCHHSPYSESKIVGSNKDVQALFVAPFLEASKTQLFITGHAHLFEHFSKEDKHFFVIGGGGGLHHPLSKKPGPEVSLDPGYDPLFHYLTVQLCDGRLKVVSRKLTDDFSGFEDGRIFDVGPPIRR